MCSFFKTFFASLLALVIFSLIIFFILLGMVKGLTSKDEEAISAKSVLMLGLTKKFPEHKASSPLSSLGEEESPALFEVLRLIRHAKEDDDISGIYVSMDGNGNGYAASNEIRNALLDFKTSKKFVIAFGNTV